MSLDFGRMEPAGVGDHLSMVALLSGVISLSNLALEFGLIHAIPVSMVGNPTTMLYPAAAGIEDCLWDLGTEYCGGNL